MKSWTKNLLFVCGLLAIGLFFEANSMAQESGFTNNAPGIRKLPVSKLPNDPAPPPTIPAAAPAATASVANDGSGAPLVCDGPNCPSGNCHTGVFRRRAILRRFR